METARRGQLVLGAAAGLALLLLAACATPVRVERVEPPAVQRELTSTAVSTGDISEPTQIVLHRQGLTELFESDPGEAIASLHRAVTAGEPDPDALFALSELSFRHAQDTGNHAYYLAAAVYAFAFLFPDDPAQRPNGFDPRFRTASDLYNRSLTSAFASADRSRVLLRSGRYELPFGSIDVTFYPATARWGDLALSEFTPADELHIKGLQVRYRQRGIGAPLLADATAAVNEKEFQVAPEVKVPLTALLRIDFSRRSLAQGHLRGTVDVYPAFEPRFVTIRGQSVPLEVDPSAAIAYSLNDSKVWESEFAGFLDGNFFDRSATQLVGLEPYRPGQIPVVFIHGTGSSPGRWADLINDLQSDPVIRGGFQFWSFSYATGNPTAFSAMELRTAIEDTVHKVDPLGRDPALQRIVLIGHSQGGLLAKWLTIDSGSRLWDTVSSKPPEALRLSAENAALARRVMFVTPLPQVRRVIFIATPQHGSLVAESPIGQFLARLATPRDRILTALRDLTENNPDVLRFDPGSARFGSVWDMSPDNPFVKAFAAIPVSPKVAAHSIIAVEGDGPAETGDDGVVTYQSAHIPEAKSELVVRSGHSVQANPQTVGEIRRILLLHLAEAYRQGSVPVAKTDRVPLADHCCGG